MEWQQLAVIASADLCNKKTRFNTSRSVHFRKLYQKKKKKFTLDGLTHFEPMCDALRDLVPFVQFKKREKHPWKSVTFSLQLY